MKRYRWLALAALLALLLGAVIANAQTGDGASPPLSTGYDLSWQVLSSGGGPMSSSNYALNGTIGQAAIGSAESTNHEVGAGYWYGVVIQIGPVEFKVYLPLILKNY